jgi:hypothetical protein
MEAIPEFIYDSFAKDAQQTASPWILYGQNRQRRRYNKQGRTRQEDKRDSDCEHAEANHQYQQSSHRTR